MSGREPSHAFMSAGSAGGNWSFGRTGMGTIRRPGVTIATHLSPSWKSGSSPDAMRRARANTERRSFGTSTFSSCGVNLSVGSEGSLTAMNHQSNKADTGKTEADE